MPASYSPIMRFFKKPAVIGWLVFTILLLAVAFLSYQRFLIFDARRTRELNDITLNARERIKNVLNYSLTATKTLSFIIQRNQGKADFDSLAKQLLESNKFIDAVELVEGGTITHVYPLAGNEEALGYNILSDSAVNKEAQRAINENGLYFAGPLKLKQGYDAIVGRLPIYVNNKFWGFSAVLIKLSTLIKAAQLDSTPGRDYIFQLSKLDPNTGEEHFFLPTPHLFRKEHSASVNVTEGDWRIYARFVKPETLGFLLPFSILGLLLAISGGWFAWYGARQPYRLNLQVDEKTKQLRESEEKYFSFFENASDSIIVIDQEGVIVDVNISLCRLLDYSKNELTGKKFSDLEDAEQVRADPFRFDLQESGKEIVKERRLKKRDGDFVELELNVKVIDDNRFLAIGRDLSDLRSVQKQIALSESTLRGAFEHSAIGMALVSPQGKWLRVNNALCQMLGYNEEEMLNLSFKDITHPDDLNSSIQFLGDALNAASNFYRTEKRYIDKHGSQIWVNLNVSSVRDANGQLLYFVTQTEDITEKKKFSELLEEREKQLRQFVEHSPAALAMFDSDMRYIIASKRWLSDYDLEGKQVIGKKHYDLFPNIPQRWKDIHKKCLEGATDKSDEDFYIDENGKSAWLKWEVQPWRRYDGEIRGIIIFTEVITALKEADLKFRNLVEQSVVGVYIVQNGKFAYVNPRFAEIYGYTTEEMINTFPVEHVVLDEYRDFAREKIRARMDGEVESVHYEAKGRKKNGDAIFVEAYGSVTTFNGRPAIIGTLLEITERKKAEEILRDSEEKRRMMMDSSLDAIISIDESGAVISWNPQAARIFGWTEEEMIGQLLTDTIIPVQYRERHRKGIEHYLATGEGPILHQLIELSAVNKSGHEFPVELTIIPIIQKDEISFTSFVRDISERRKSEEKLIESEEKFRSLVEESLAGIYILQDSKVKYINPAHEKLMGYSLEELQNIENIETIVHDEDVAVFRDHHQVTRNEENLSRQYALRAIRKDGAIVYLEITTSPIIYEGKPALIGTMLNITDRIEEEIRISRAVNDAQENERMQIGMELHDNVKQILAASLLTIDFVKMNLSNIKSAAESLENLKKYTKSAIDELRRLSHQLAPAINNDESFGEQLEKLVRTINVDNKLKFSIEVDGSSTPLRTDLQTALYRIAQEQFNNILKYADASTVLVNIRINQKNVHLTIKDDGKGFNPAKKRNGIGLENIKRRAFVLGGKSNITSSPGRGCEVNVQIPLGLN